MPDLDPTERPGRVVYLLKKFPRLSETFIVNEILGLEAFGVQVRVFALKAPDKDPVHESVRRVRAPVTVLPERLSVDFLAYGRHAARVFLSRPARFLKTLGEALVTGSPRAVKRWAQAVCLADHLREEPEVGVHCHFALSAAGVARFLRRLNGNPYTFTAHAKDIYLRSIREDLFRKKADEASAVITVCEYNKAHMAKRLVPGRDEKIQVIHNGIDLEFFFPGPVAERDPSTILSVSRLVEKKGLHRLIEACALLRDRGVSFRLRIAGSGNQDGALRDLARTHGLEDRVEFLGALNQEQVREALRRCTLLAAPSLEARDGNLDALPTAIVEALAMATPVVSTRVTGIPEIVTDGEEGILVPPDNAVALAEALAALLADPERRTRMGRNGRKKAELRFDRQMTSRQLADALARAHGPTSPTPGIRVGYVLTMFPRLSETFILREILELESLGARVTVFSQKRPAAGPVHKAVESLRAQVVYLSPWWRVLHRTLPAHARFAMGSPRRYARLVRFFWSRRNRPTFKKFVRAAQIAREVQRRKIQHLHCHFLTGNARLTEFVTTLVDVPHSITAHAKDIYASGLSPTKMQRRLRDARFVVTISDYNRRYLLEQQPKARVELIHNSLRPAEFAFTARNGFAEERPLRVLAVGRLVPKKGFSVLVEAVARLRKEGCPFEVRIVGEGEERDRISSLIATHDLGELVSLTGQKSQEELREDFAWADVFVVPSVPAPDGDIDGVPVVLLEAMAMGVPVIASRLSGIPEVVLDGETGLLTEPGSVEDLAASLRRARPPALNDFARAARKRLEANYDIDKNCRRLLRLMEKAARKAAS